MVEDAQASVLLTESKFQEAFVAECGGESLSGR